TLGWRCPSPSTDSPDDLRREYEPLNEAQHTHRQRSDNHLGVWQSGETNRKRRKKVRKKAGRVRHQGKDESWQLSTLAVGRNDDDHRSDDDGPNSPYPVKNFYACLIQDRFVSFVLFLRVLREEGS